MIDYFQEARYELDLVYFHYCGIRYQGRGIMTWNPEEGFHLEVIFDRSQRNSFTRRLGKIGVIPRSDYFSIRMRPQGYDWAIAPHIYLTDFDWFNLERRYLSKSLKRVIFCESAPPVYPNSVWAGFALYITKSSDLKLTDNVKNSVHINNQPFSRCGRSSGIWYGDEQGYTLRGHLNDQRRLQLYWQIPRHCWLKSQGWRWALSIQDALSIWHGETIILLQREMHRGAQRITEIRKQEELDSLEFLSPLGGIDLNHDSLMRLTKFFTRNSQDANVCRRIFWQLVEASRQQGWQARELLVATILEAALRTIYNYPLQQSDNSKGLVKDCLARFRSRFFPTEPDELKKDWKKACTEVLETFLRVRHRNAHPDWLVNSGGGLSEERLEESFDDLMLLSRFYGYMILGLAGFEDSVPSFPPPCRSRSTGTVTRLESNDDIPDSPTLPFWNPEDFSPTSPLRDLSNARTCYEYTMIERKFYLEQANNSSSNSSDP